MTDEIDELAGRAARLRAAFPGAATELGDTIVSFSMGAIREQLARDAGGGGWLAPHRTPEGIEFVFERDGGIWISVETQVGHSIAAWSWRLSPASWRAVKEASAAAEPAP